MRPLQRADQVITPCPSHTASAPTCRAILNPNKKEAAANEYPSGEHWIVELDTSNNADPPLVPGEYTIEVGAVTDFATFNLRVDIERKGQQMDREAIDVRPTSFVPMPAVLCLL